MQSWFESANKVKQARKIVAEFGPRMMSIDMKARFQHEWSGPLEL